MTGQNSENLPEKASSRALQSRRVSSTLTIGGVTVACVGAVSVLAFAGSWIGLFAVVLGMIAGTVGVVGSFVARNRYRSAALGEMHQEISRESASAEYQLRRQLTRLRYETHVESEATRALTQLSQIEERFGRFDALLREKMNPGELTFDRYHGVAESAVRNVVAGLEEAARVIGELQSLRAEGAGAARSEREKRIAALLGANEKAIAQLDDLNSALGRITDSDGDVVKRLEATLGELEHLAKQADKYSA